MLHSCRAIKRNKWPVPTSYLFRRVQGEGTMVGDVGLRDSVSVQLERMLSRPPLASSPSLSRLLRFLVEETLAGRRAELNEYNLGVRVFQRNADFNPRADPIVRVQMHHLRARLTQYYAGPGAADPVVVELPGRTYVPQFGPEAQVAPPPPPEEPAPPARRTAGGVVTMGAVVLLVTSLGVGLVGRPGQGRGKHHDPDPAAQNLYTRGRYLLDRQTEPALRQSADCFRQSTARDPRFAAAFAGLADALDMLVQYG